MKIEIRDAQLEDLNKINDLLRVIEKSAIQENYLKHYDIKMLYADNMFIGFYNFIIADDLSLVLDNFFIHPDYTRQGLGRELWKMCCDTASQSGYDEFILFSDPNAEDFYLKMGCTKSGERPSFMIPNRNNPILKYKIKSKK